MLASPCRTNSNFGALSALVAVALLFVASGARAQSRLCLASYGVICVNLDGSSSTIFPLDGLGMEPDNIAYPVVAYDPGAHKIYWAEITHVSSVFSAVEPVSTVKYGTLNSNGTAITDIATAFVVTNHEMNTLVIDGVGHKAYYSVLGDPNTSGDPGFVGRSNLDGSSPEQLSTGSSHSIAVDALAGKLYRIPYTLDPIIVQSNLDGTAPTTAATFSKRVAVFARDNDTGSFYAVTFAGGPPYSIEKFESGVGATTLTTFPTMADADNIQVDSTGHRLFFYYQSPAGAGSIATLNMDGTGLAVVPTSGFLPVFSGIVMIDPCLPTQYMHAGTCVDCTTCTGNTYASPRCTHTTDTFCAACTTTACASTEYLATECSTYADKHCASCDPTCTTCSGPGASSCTSCIGSDYLQSGTCMACTTCPAETYAASFCSATADAVCLSCGVCSGGGYVATACGAATDTVCGACDAACATCTGAGTTHCTSCNAGFYLSGTTCNPCTVCGTGNVQVAACTATTDTICQPMPSDDAGVMDAAMDDAEVADAGPVDLGRVDSGVEVDAGTETDAGVTPPKKSGGCTVATTQSNSFASLAGIASLALAFVVRRRKR